MKIKVDNFENVEQVIRDHEKMLAEHYKNGFVFDPEFEANKRFYRLGCEAKISTGKGTKYASVYNHRVFNKDHAPVVFSGEFNARKVDGGFYFYSTDKNIRWFVSEHLAKDYFGI